MSAPVEKRHRALAFSMLWSAKPYTKEQAWIETGAGDPGPRLVQATEALTVFERETREKTIRECANALSECGDVDTEGGGAWLLARYADELSAKEPGR